LPLLSGKPRPAQNAHVVPYRLVIGWLLSGLFATNTYARPVDPVEREEKRQARELRRKCDRLRLEAALGFDPELLALISREGT
jgi:hypothetical protein